MNKLEQAAREVIRQHSMECLSDKTVDALREALAVSEQRMEEQAEQEPVLYPVRRGSRITCIESGEKCVVWATSHTDCWVQFPDGHAGQYTYEQIGKYFSIEENQAADEAYERGSKEGIEAGKKTEQAEQEPVAVVEIAYGREPECYVTGNIDDFPEGVFKLYASPVRTKDLTAQEKANIIYAADHRNPMAMIDAAIALYREKNK